ncbi:MAG: TrkH family potassium uptake protein [Gammaproteobacteria bacterium]|jgi:trk system potassium uptake protein TrkH
MGFASTFRTLGVLFVVFGLTLFPPLVVSLLYQDGNTAAYLETALIAVLAGSAIYVPFSWAAKTSMRQRHSFLIVALMWVSMSVLGSVPFVLTLDMSFVDALFESTSGYTTTGATVLTGLDELPRSILFYRQEIQWFGGVGVVVLAIALLPMLGVGGMQLYKAETPGPFKDEKLTPRVARTARNVWLVYFGLTAACALAYFFAGMEPFDAVAHSLTTVSTGGYSTHDASIGYFNSPLIEAVAILFMVIGAISFSTHFVALSARRPSAYRSDSQLRAFLSVIFVTGLIVTAVLYSQSDTPSMTDAVRRGAFEVISVVTSTGYGIDDFSVWPLALPVILIFTSFIGGCAGSTAGGMKVIRFVVLAKQVGVHLRRLIHPKSVWRVKVEGRVVPDAVIDGIWGFFTVYVIVFSILMIALMFDGMDQVTAFSAVATTLNNLGPGLNEVSGNFLSVTSETKLILVLAMILGRLEIFTILVLIAPSFWKE